MGVQAPTNHPLAALARIDRGSATTWLLGFAPIFYLALSGGGYDTILRTEVGLLAWSFILLGALVGVIPRVRLTPAAWVALALLGGFLVWTWVAVAWSQSEEWTLIEVARVATYLGVLALALAVVRHGTARSLLNGVASAIALVAGLAVLYRLAPSLFPADTGSRFYEVAQLQYPFEYSDAVGEFFALGLPLLLMLTLAGRTATGRAAAGVGSVLAAVCLVMTASHGGVFAAVVGLVVLALLARQRSWLPRSRRRQVMALVAAAIALAVAVAVITGLVHQVWVDFKQPHGGGQLSLAGSHRYQYWSAALGAFESRPWRGIGPGTFQFYWAQHNSLNEFVLNAHSLYFEALAEAGIVGLLLVVGLFVTVLVAGARVVFDTGGPERLTAAAAVAGFAAFCAAAGYDWVWQIGAVPVAALLLAALALSAPHRESAAPSRLGGKRVLLALASIAALGSLVVPLATTVEVRKSQMAAAAADYHAALADAASAHRIEPGAATPRLQQGLILEQLGEPARALHALSQARADEPTNWRLWAVASRLETEADRPGRAFADYLRARALNPTSPLFKATARLVPIAGEPLSALLVPPGKAGANQYFETIPGAAGNLAPPRPRPTAQDLNRATWAGSGKGTAVAPALARFGAHGSAAAKLAAATALPSGTHAHDLRAPHGESPPLAIASMLAGSDAGGMGPLLAILLVAVVAAGVVMRRQATAS